MDTPRRMLAVVCLLLGVWIVTYWAYPARKQKITRDEPVPAADTPPKITLDPTPTPSPQPQPLPFPPRDSPKPPQTHKVKRLLKPVFREYTVQKGDVSMEKIASRPEVYGNSKMGDVVSQANPLVTPNKLKPGVTKLKIPVDPTNIQGKEVWVDEPIDGGIASNDPETPPVEPPPAKTYVIKSSDTLSEIAEKFYGKSAMWRKIYEANKGVISDPDRLTAGATITIPAE